MLENKLRSFTEQLKTNENNEEIKTRLQGALEEQERKWIKKYSDKESQHLTMVDKVTVLQDLLSKHELELSALKSSTSDSTSTITAQLTLKDNEIDRLNKKIKQMERQSSDEISKLSETVSGLNAEKSTMINKVDNLRLIYHSI